MVNYVRCMYDFTGGSGKLTFSKNDIIRVIKESDTGWDHGELEGTEGWYPSTYVEPYQLTSVDLAEMNDAIPDVSEAATVSQAGSPASVHNDEKVQVPKTPEPAVIVLYHDRSAIVDNFWERGKDGRTGLEHVIKHMNDGLKSLEQAHKVISQRAALDREYARGLRVLAMENRAELLEGSLKTPLTEVCCTSMLAEADMYTECVNTLGQGSALSTSVEQFNKSTKILMDKYSVKIGQCRETKARYHAQAEKSKAVYMRLCRDTQAAGKLGEGKIRKKIDALHMEYAEHLKNRNSSLQNEIDALCEAYDAFEAKDLERIKLFQTVFNDYVDICNKKGHTLTGVHVKSPPMLKEIDACKDLENFIKQNRTGARREQPLEVESYDPRAFEMHKKKGRK